MASQRKWVLGAVLIGILAVTGWMVWHRRDRGGSPTPAGPQTLSAVVRPADMPGLGYLPASTEAIIAVQVPLLLEKLGPESPDDPAEALRQLGIPDAAIDVVERASGVGLKDVEQLVVGLDFAQAAFPPRMVVVVHSRQPFDLTRIAREAKSNRLRREGRTLTVTRFSRIVELFWWAPTDRVLIATLMAKDYDAIPAQPQPGVGHLRPEVADLIRDRVAEDACAWVAASSDRWDEYLRLYTILPLTPLLGRGDLIAPAGRLRSVTLAIPAPAEQMVDLQLGLKTVDAAEELRAALAGRFRGEPVEVSGEGELVRVQTAFESMRLRSVISRLVPPRK